MAHAETADFLDTPSVDPEEVEKFSRMAAEWWDPESKFKPLHKFNPTRLNYLRDRICEHFGREGDKPFKGLRILDIGCGGGLVSEPMARLGATVVGVDAAEANVKTAMVHAREQGLDIDYRHGAAELLLERGEAPFDVVLNLEVVEHVADPDRFLRDCAALVKPGGLMAVASINRTPQAFALAILGAEWILGWLPRGTHRFHKLVKPSEARHALSGAGLEVREPVGMSYSPLTDRWSVSRDPSVNYMMMAARPA